MTSADTDLLKAYVEGSQSAFNELVARYLNLVYSAALRQVGGNSHLAKEVTQLVFTDLAKKAGRLIHHPELTGWLYTGTRFAALQVLRAENRRRRHEEKIITMSPPALPAEIKWDEVRSIFDELLHELNPADRRVILLRYFENQSFTEIGKRTGLSENTARMRTDRALEKLRLRLCRRKIMSSAAALAALISAEAVSAAPAFEVLAGSAATPPISGFGLFMTSTKLLKIGTIGLLLLSFGTVLHFTRELKNARATHLLLDQQRTELDAELATADTKLGDLKKQLSVVQPTTPPHNPSLGGDEPQTRSASAEAELRDLLLSERKEKSGRDAALLFQKLGLSKTLLSQYVERLARADRETFLPAYLEANARARGLSLQAYKDVAARELEQDLRSLLGDSAYEQIQQAKADEMLNAPIKQLAADLMFSDVPLAQSQISQLSAVLASNRAAIDQSRGHLPEPVVSQAQLILSPEQFAAWHQRLTLEQRLPDLVKKINSQ
jgi:RNA polymerase sigma factor (sigma-70 family)